MRAVKPVLRPSDTAEARARYLAEMEQRRAVLRLALATAIGEAPSVVLEVGCGHGHFLTAYARLHPHELCLGIDIASDRVARANRKREHARLKNLHFIRAAASLLLDVLPNTASLSSVFILFPDPWPKLRHHKHRLMRTEFLARLAGRLGEGGRVYFRTDHEPYFESVCSDLRKDSPLVVVDEPWRFEHTTVFQSRARIYHSIVAKARSLPA